MAVAVAIPARRDYNEGLHGGTGRVLIEALLGSLSSVAALGQYRPDARGHRVVRIECRQHAH